MISKKEQLKYIDKKSDRRKLQGECHKLWREIVFMRAGYKCEFPGCRRDNEHFKLNPHHYYTKGAHPALRFDIENGIALCYPHHKGSAEAAHSDPDWKDKILGKMSGYKAIRNENWSFRMMRKAATSCSIDLKLELIYLQQEYERCRQKFNC